MEQLAEYTLEECDAGGWNAQFNPEQYAEIADRIRTNVELDIDTEHMLLWHMNDVKLSFQKSSGVMRVRTDDKEKAEELVEAAIQ